MAMKSFFDTGFAHVAGSKPAAVNALKFIVNNSNIYLPEYIADKLYTGRALIEAPTTNIFKHLHSTGKLGSLFAPIFLNRSISNIPEILTHSAITLDLAQLEESTILKTLPDYYNKVIINLGGVVKQLNNGEFQVVDRTILHNLFVRGALVMSYHDSDGWLSPNMGVFIAKSYSIIISGLIAREYNLTIAEQMDAAAVLSLYMCQMLSRKSDDLSRPPLFNRCTYLGSATVLQEYLNEMAGVSKDKLTIPSVCKLLAQMCPERVGRTLHPGILYRLTSTLAGDLPSSQISLEYPPYWVFHICTSMSGAKLRLFNELKTNKLHEEAKRFLFDLTNSMLFIGDLPDSATLRI